MEVDKLFWDASIDEIKQGYIYNQKDEKYICLICGKEFEKGVIYPHDNFLFEAERAVKKHIEIIHGSVFEYLINMNKKYTGLTDIQNELLKYFYKGLSDKEIIQKNGGGSTSTIRNHRFRLKEKEKQAKVFLAIMSLLENNHRKDESLINIHKGATMVDERYAITEAEKEKIIKRYFEDEGNGKLISLPRKEKRKIIVLSHILKKFVGNKKYTEREVNDILKKIQEDYVILRRYLIEYGFLDRTNDCSSYWVKN